MSEKSSLPHSTADADPPPYIKERLMARLHRERVSNTSDEYGPIYGAPVPVLTRLLNFVPGYGSRHSLEPERRRTSALRRRASIFLALLFGSLASAFAIGRLSHVVQRADAAREVVVERVRHTHAYQEKFVAPLLAARLASASTNTIDLGSGSASLMPKTPEELTIRPIDPLHLPSAKLSLTSKAQPRQVTPQAVFEDESIDLNTLEGALYFMSDRTGQHFTLKPVNDVEQGKATIYWNPKHTEALFTAEDLEPTPDGSRYTLCYLFDDGTREQLLAFEATGGGHRQVTIHRVPGPHVIGAQLMLESGYKTGQTNREVVLAAAARLQNK